MNHSVSLITTIAAGFGVALLLGFLAERIKLPALVGYLLAGIVIGPATPGFVADMHIASQLSEIGVMLLMFGVGLHFSLKDLLAVKRIAIPGALVQMAISTSLGIALALSWHWKAGAGLVLGISLACASTVVLLKSLEAKGLLSSITGRIAIGWLVVQDLATVLVLVLVPPLSVVLGGIDAPIQGTPHSLLWTIGTTLLQVVAFIAFMLIAGRRLFPWFLGQVAHTGSRELFTLSVIAVAIGIAYGATALFNVSFALGAFFAGMVLGESDLSHRAAEESLPLRDAFSVLFFVSVGMIFDPRILIHEPLHVLEILGVIVVGNSLAAAVIVLMFRYSFNAALTVAASLGQIGEFSIILAGLGHVHGVLPSEGMSLVLAGVLISMAFNRLLFGTIEPVERWLLKHSSIARRIQERHDPIAELPVTTEHKYLSGQVILVGYGRVGQRIAHTLDANNIPYLVVEQNREYVEALRKRGIVAVAGDATHNEVLTEAHIMEAALLVVATPDPLSVRQIADAARALNPRLEIVLRTHSEEESAVLNKEGLGAVFFGEQELAKGMANHILKRYSS